MKILIGGDLVPTESNKNLFIDGNIDRLLGEKLLTIWNNADIRIFNLEVPLVNKMSPINKNGPNLIAEKETIKGIKQLNPSLLTLANNHILDQGYQGLDSTIKVLKENNIPYLGAGNNILEASRYYIIQLENKKIGVYACAENEFTIADQNSPGANPFDPLESLDHISELKKMSDYVIVLYHGGKEHYRYPSPYLQKVCRKMTQKGADVVICQHSHCIGSYEEYENSTIIYGQGNFIFDYSNSEFWENSLLIEINIDEGIKIEYIPIVKYDNCIRLASNAESKNIMNNFEERSREILKCGFIEKQYENMAYENINKYLRKIAKYNNIIEKIDRKILKSYLLKKRYNKTELLQLQNFIECEAHRELILKGISLLQNQR